MQRSNLSAIESFLGASEDEIFLSERSLLSLEEDVRLKSFCHRIFF
ncbi:MAG: hypothetical protein QNJ74_28220 [Trichodesmium sp. MO_231.B1]|nr:hypothetical protein [Trichodesmium sp. MO_231.B1]